MECIQLWCVVVYSAVLCVHANGKWLNGSIWENATLAFHSVHQYVLVCVYLCVRVYVHLRVCVFM